MKRTLVPLLMTSLGVAALLALAACSNWGSQPTATTTPAPPTAVVMGTGTDDAAVSAAATLPAAVTPEPTYPITPTATFTATFTATPTSNAAVLLIRTALNIRSGPGQTYALLGQFGADADAEILGRSADDQWWRVACPEGVTTDECWVVADPLFSESMTTTVPAVAAAPALSEATESPTAEPCIRTRPGGWVPHRVKRGETLWEIAESSGVDLAELSTVNCAGEILAEDAIIYVPQTLAQGTIDAGESVAAPSLPPPSVLSPAAVALPAGAALAGESTEDDGSDGADGTPRVNGDAPELASLLGFVNPGVQLCASDGTAPLRSIKISPTPRPTGWEPGDAVGICLDGFGDELPVITVWPPGRTPVFLSDPLNARPVWRYGIRPDTPAGVYTVTVTGDDTVLPATFTTTAGSSQRRIAVLTDHVGVGMPIPFAVVGFPADKLRLFLCGDDPDTGEVDCRIITGITVNNDGWSVVSLPVPDLAANRWYAIHDGEAADEPLARRVDPRTFYVKGTP